jgi:hypothetical protein
VPIEYAFTTFYILIGVDRKIDRNAENHQRTILNIDERETTLKATERTMKKIQKQRSPYPPFGIAKY